jgi:zona occludens toxin
MGYPIFSRWFKVAQTAETPTAKQIKITNQPTQLSLNPTLLDQNHQIGDSENRPLTAADLQPVSPLAPWSAPLYRSSFHVESVPHFSGCISTPKKCSCYTQQGTSLDVDTKTCLSVIQQNNMPFNPMKKDSDDKPYQPQTEQEQVLARTQPIVIGGLNTEQQQQRTTSLNESWKNPRSQLNSRM